MSNPANSKRFDLPCMILAGGQSRRFGSNKAFAQFRGARLIDSLLERIEDQTAGPIAINAPSGAGLGDLNLPLVADLLSGSLGPLAGIHAALNWAEQAGYAAVLTSPVDTPLLPKNYVERLVETGAPAIAKCDDRLHFLHGLWPTHLREKLALAVENGLRSARDWATESQAVVCEFHYQAGLDPFFNVNTPEDLQTLENG
ncbi:MAG: molybdenum cofactor guanylyltransferase [Pseudomonadota bacterium]